jgi:hypothetical protein
MIVRIIWFGSIFGFDTLLYCCAALTFIINMVADAENKP